MQKIELITQGYFPMLAFPILRKRDPSQDIGQISQYFYMLYVICRSKILVILEIDVKRKKISDSFTPPY